MINRKLTSGLFPVETAGIPLSPDNVPEGFHPYTLFVFVKSFLDEAHVVSYRVLQLNEAGSKIPLHEGTLQVPARGIAHFSSHDIPGKTLEVNLSLPSRHLLPSVQLIHTFLADGATQPVIWISPEQFVAYQTPILAGPNGTPQPQTHQHNVAERQRPAHTRHVRPRRHRRTRRNRQH